MQRIVAAVAALLAAGALPAAAGAGQDLKGDPLAQTGACVVPGAQAALPSAAKPVLVQGLGFSGITPDTADPEARRWFDQGVALIWAFDEAEAVRAFHEAQRIAPDCALCFWGEAWARGPTINLTDRPEELAAAKKAADRAAALSADLPPRDKALVDAIRLRASGDGAFRKADYARAMLALASRHPGDDTVATMAADAWMTDADWDRIEPGSPAQMLLEGVLARNPDHSGAIHFYIHLTDAIDRQKLAEPYADRLGGIAPAASHLVHMPSHTFFGVGRYGDAMQVNLAALAAGRRYDAAVTPPPTDYRTGLMGHNAHFVMQSGLMHGDMASALAGAREFATSFPDGGPPYAALLHAATFVVHGIGGATMPDPGRSPLMKAAAAYGLGERAARAGDVVGVRRQAAAVRAALRMRDFPLVGAGGKEGRAYAEIAALVLDGRAHMLAGNPRKAASAFRRATQIQQGADFGFDPPAWWFPVRRSLGAATLAAGDARGARLQLLASLRRWPQDPLALWALSQAEAKRGDAAAAAAALAAAKKGWAGDVEQVPLSAI